VTFGSITKKRYTQRQHTVDLKVADSASKGRENRRVLPRLLCRGGEKEKDTDNQILLHASNQSSYLFKTRLKNLTIGNQRDAFWGGLLGGGVLVVVVVCFFVGGGLCGLCGVVLCGLVCWGLFFLVGGVGVFGVVWGGSLGPKKRNAGKKTAIDTGFTSFEHRGEERDCIGGVGKEECLRNGSTVKEKRVRDEEWKTKDEDGRSKDDKGERKDQRGQKRTSHHDQGMRGLVGKCR